MRRLFQPLTSQNSNDIISVSHRGAIIIPLLSLIAILLCGNNNDSTKKPRCKSSVLFLRGFLDALARVPVAPLGYRLRVAPGPRLPRRSLACGRFAPGAHRSFAQARQKAKAPLGPWGLSRRFAFGFCPARRSQTLRPGTPRRSTSLNKRTRVKATPGFAALAFFRFALPCLVLRLVRLCSLAALLGRVPPPGPSYRRSLFSRLRWPAPFGLPRAFRRRGSRLVAIAPGARCAPLPPRRFFLRVLPLPFQPPPRPANLGGGRKEVMRVFFAL